MEINKLKMDNTNPSLDFKFQPELKSNLNLELPFTEHVEEFPTVHESCRIEPD